MPIQLLIIDKAKNQLLADLEELSKMLSGLKKSINNELITKN